MEYAYSSRLKLRLGYEPRPSGIPDDKRSALAPINAGRLYGAGLGYRFDRNTDIDLTMAHLRYRDNIPANTSSLLNETGVNNLLYNPFAGLDVQTKAVVNIVGLVYRTRW